MGDVAGKSSVRSMHQKAHIPNGKPYAFIPICGGKFLDHITPEKQR